MKQSAYSLKKRLLLWISIPVLVAALATAILAFLFSWHEIEEVYDAQLVHSAKVLLQMTEHEILESGTGTITLGAENPSLQHRYEKKMAFRIWHNDRLITSSGKAAEFDNLQAQPGFSDQTINGKPWRFFVFIDSNTNLRIETSERYAIRYELISQLMSSLIIPTIIFIPIIFIVVWVGAGRSLRPLRQLSQAVDSRHSDDLTEISTSGIPEEVLPLTHAMNRLLRRMAESFRREREFTDHAAHELRTPLAAMKTQTQVLIKKFAQTPDARDGLDNLHHTIDRSTHLIEQILSMARIQNESLVFDETDLSHCLRQETDSMLSFARAKSHIVNIDIDDHVIIRGNAEALYILLRNLLMNAVKYTPDGGTISVSLSKDGHLEIADTGIGIPDRDKDRVFGRFVRADQSGQTGSGLGLSIAAWIANAHGVAITLADNMPNGLIVKIKWNPIT